MFTFTLAKYTYLYLYRIHVPSQHEYLLVFIERGSNNAEANHIRDGHTDTHCYNVKVLIYKKSELKRGWLIMQHELILRIYYMYMVVKKSRTQAGIELQPLGYRPTALSTELLRP